MDYIDEVADINGAMVRVGTKVKLISLPKWLLEILPEWESDQLRQMVGKVFEVDETDKYGGAWVEMRFEGKDNDFFVHSVSLNPSEMEIVKD